MKEPNKIRLNPDAPTTKEPNKYRLLPLDKTEWDVTGQNNDDVYIPLDLDKSNKPLDKINEDNSKNN
jgi:hypothetical protein